MSSIFLLAIIAAAFLLALITNLTAKPHISARVLGGAAIAAALGGLLIHGMAYSQLGEELPLAFSRALFAVCGMFIGENSYDFVSEAPMMQTVWVQVLFWALHVFILYITASAAIAAVGSGAVRRLRLWLWRRGTLRVIYGVTQDSAAFGCQLAEEKRDCVVFVDEDPESGAAERITEAGLVVRSDPRALNPGKGFLRAVGLGKKRRVELYCLNRDGSSDLEYGRKFLAALEKMGIPFAQTGITLAGDLPSVGASLQATGERYGYGSVQIFSEPDLTARMAVLAFPPLDGLTADKSGRCSQDLEVLIVGFGRMGQAMLRNVVMSGQAAGNRFHGAVFARDIREASGHFNANYRGMLEHFDIDYFGFDARSPEMYDYLRENGNKLKYIAVCAGSDRQNRELALEISASLEKLGCPIPLVLCSQTTACRITCDGRPPETRYIYSPDVLCPERLDRMAMEVNQAYCRKNGKTREENWAACDYFSRLSCRAFADIVPAFLRYAGTTKEAVLAGTWKPTPEQMDAYGQMEHSRWCAFHFAMGYNTMPREVFEARKAQYLREKAETGKGSIRMGKDPGARLHACLINWDELDALSAAENAVTGENEDYKKKDKDNICSIRDLLLAVQEA